MHSIVDITPWQVGLACGFVLAVLVIVRMRGISREREIIISSLRMTLQLVLTGYILTHIFDHPSPLVTGAIIVLMELFAIHTIFSKFKGRLSPAFKRVIAFSLGSGTLGCVGYFLLVVVRIPVWYDPRYVIPIAGMIIGNSMTGITLGIKSLLEGMTSHKHLIEEALMLGATPAAATRAIINRTFDAAIMPTINSMTGMGIIFLPGMMTGQILSGTAPATAIAYQIAIMFGILGAVALTIILTLQMGYRTFFNHEAQLKT